MTEDVTVPPDTIVEVYLTRPADSFNRVVVAGQNDVVTNEPNQTLTLVAGSGMTITTDESTNTITLIGSGGGSGDVDGGTF